MFVEQRDVDAAQRRDLKVSGAVFLDRHRAEDALERGGAAVANGRTAATMIVGGLGQILHDEELLDLAAFQACHVAARVNVLHKERGAGLGEIRTGWNHRLARAGEERARFVGHLRRVVDHAGLAGVVEEEDLVALGDKELA